MLPSLSSSSTAVPVSVNSQPTPDSTALPAADIGSTDRVDAVFSGLVLTETAEPEAELPLAVAAEEEVQTSVAVAPDAEQWMRNVLDQQQVQLQVRDLQDAIRQSQQPQDEQVPVDRLNATDLRTPAFTQGVAAADVTTRTSGVAEALPSTGRLREQTISANADRNLAMTNPALTLWVNRTAETGLLPANPGTPSSASDAAEPLATLTGVAIDALVPDRVAVSPGNLAVVNPGDKTVQDIASQTPVKLPTPEAKWGEQLLHTLRDQVQVQIQQRIQNATIRLDPPELGSLEIFLSHESGRLNVHINASQADVARLLQHTSDRLRHELAGGQFTQVNVQTSNDGQSGQQQSRHGARHFAAGEIIQANGQTSQDSSRTDSGQSSDVLITV